MDRDKINGEEMPEALISPEGLAFFNNGPLRVSFLKQCNYIFDYTNVAGFNNPAPVFPLKFNMLQESGRDGE